MKTKFALPKLILLSATLAASLSPALADSVWLSSLDLSKAKITGNIKPGLDKGIAGKPLTIARQTFDKGICLNGYSLIYFQLDGGSDKFSAVLGVDDESAPPAAGTAAANATNQLPVAAGTTNSALAGAGRAGRPGFGPAPPPAMSIRILADDGLVLFQTNSIPVNSNGVPVELNTKGVKLLAIVVDNAAVARGRGGRGAPAHFDLANAKFEVSSAKPICVAVSGDEREMLTPKPGPMPKINGPELAGVSPGRPVLYKIPATGAAPLTYTAERLPDGLTVDPASGIVSGAIKERGTYPVTFHVKNSLGRATRDFKFVAEGQLALTPALGWNSWNVYGRNVSDALARLNADAMVSKGLIDHGWTYINLDDGWERSPRPGDALNEGPTRDEAGNYLTNKKFPDMKALGDYIHSKGLKYGIYSSPGPTTCQGLEASFKHEESDVAQWCSWGVDYLKYDWCSYRSEAGPGLEGQKKPYQVMRAAINHKATRDILFSMCQYGMGNVWEWGAEPDIGGNSWRTTGDISDNWRSMSNIGFNPGPRGAGAGVDLSGYAGPGHWNDPDMLVVGRLGWAGSLRDSNLTPSEQYTHITLWTLYPSPLLLGCDLPSADDFTIGLLSNDEVLAIHQDPLGKGAKAFYRSPNGQMKQVWARPLADGSKAVGLFNLEEVPVKVTAKWSDVGLTGKQKIRDVWRQKELGTFTDEFTSEVPRHGCLLLKITAKS